MTGLVQPVCRGLKCNSDKDLLNSEEFQSTVSFLTLLRLLCGHRLNLSHQNVIKITDYPTLPLHCSYRLCWSIVYAENLLLDLILHFFLSLFCQSFLRLSKAAAIRTSCCAWPAVLARRRWSLRWRAVLNQE